MQVSRRRVSGDNARIVSCLTTRTSQSFQYSFVGEFSPVLSHYGSKVIVSTFVQFRIKLSLSGSERIARTRVEINT